MVEEIPGEGGMKKITHENEAWDLLNFKVLKITAHQNIKVTIIKRIG